MVILVPGAVTSEPFDPDAGPADLAYPAGAISEKSTYNFLRKAY